MNKPRIHHTIGQPLVIGCYSSKFAIISKFKTDPFNKSGRRFNHVMAQQSQKAWMEYSIFRTAYISHYRFRNSNNNTYWFPHIKVDLSDKSGHDLQRI